jgi:hypothetical protein
MTLGDDGVMKDALAHVLWLGGSPRAGKTTIARLLAGKYNLKIYSLDWHYWREHQERLDPARHPVSQRMKHATSDEWWVAPTGDEVGDRAVALWNETFEFVVDDLRSLPRSRAILAEGPGAFPWAVAPLLSSPRQALFLVPTLSFRDAVQAGRQGADQFGANTSDPERARANHRAHDVALTARVVSACAGLGLRWVEVDGTRDLGAMLALVEEHFQPFLPTTLNV